MPPMSFLPEYFTYTVRSYVMVKDHNGVESVREGLVIVRRRFREFRLLHKCLAANNTGFILPALPAAVVHRK